MDPDRPFVIEFFGLPGSGKTTVSKELLRLLQNDGTEIHEGATVTRDHLPKRQRTQARLRLICREAPHLYPMLGTLSGVLLQRQRSLKTQVKAAYVCATVSALQSQIGRLGTNIILDQGTAQAAWTVLLESHQARSTEALQTRMRARAKQHEWHVVILDTADGIIRQRLSDRESKHSRLQFKENQMDTSIWRRAKSAYDQVASELKTAADQGALTLTRLTSDGALPTDIALKISEALSYHRKVRRDVEAEASADIIGQTYQSIL